MKKTLLTMAAAIALVGCSQEDLLTGQQNGNMKGAVGVNTFVSKGTRGVAFNDVDEFKVTENNFDLFAYESNGNQFMGTTTDGIEFAYNNGWDYVDKGEVKFWKQVTEGNTVDFYAVSPANTSEVNIGYDYENGAQTITYTVADNSEDQKDLMYARTAAVDPTSEDIINNGVQINFYHALSQIVFKAKTHEDYLDYINATVTRVEVVKLQNTGTFTFKDAGFEDFSTDYTPWTYTGGEASYVAEVDAENGVEVNSNLTSADDNEAVDLTTSSTALLLLPQEITGATIENPQTPPTSEEGSYFKVTCKVYYTDKNGNQEQIVGTDNNTAEIYIPLTTTWKAGYKYVYTFVFSHNVGNPVTVNENLYVGPWYKDENNGEGGENGDNNGGYVTPTEQWVAATYLTHNNSNILIEDANDLAEARDYINAGYQYKFGEGEDDRVYYLSNNGGVEAASEDDDTMIEGDAPIRESEYLRFYDADYYQVGNVDLSNSGDWTPIGTQENKFNGTYDVYIDVTSALTINGLTISTIADEAYVGLFGYVTRIAKISNITMTDIAIGSTDTALSDLTGYAGAIVGKADDDGAEIKNCNVLSGSINAYYAAGIAIIVEDGDIINCTNSASIRGKNYASGIVYTTYNGVVKDCVNKGNVDANNYAAGIVADRSGSGIVNCTNEGNITAQTASGIVGGNSKAEYCCNKGNITGKNSAGGIIATHTSSTVIASWNEGTVKATSEDGEAGGIIGEAGNWIDIVGCYNVGTVEGTTVGNIIGLIDLDASLFGESCKQNIISCYASNNIALIGKIAAAPEKWETNNYTPEYKMNISNCYYTSTSAVTVNESGEELSGMTQVSNENNTLLYWEDGLDAVDNDAPMQGLNTGLSALNNYSTSSTYTFIPGSDNHMLKLQSNN